ncbi:MAG TPA: DinB family protein, partial [Burkholderiales bacterium]|nr:DinB family protein [Burkholderiales bacterium]
VKEYLTQQGVAFESIDVAARPEAMKDLLAFGVKTVPVVARGGEFVFAQALEDVSRFIGRKFAAKRLPPQELVDKWLTVLRAAQRHVQQLPATRLAERAVHSRDRSIRDLAYHVYQVPDAFLQAVENGLEDLTTTYNAPPPASVVSTRDIQKYGESVTARIERWWSQLPDKSCRQKVKTYYGERSLHELLERCTWHSAQHARQIASVLERLQLKPDGPLSAKDYAGLPMPQGLWE